MAITHKKIEPELKSRLYLGNNYFIFFIICQNGMLRPKFNDAFEVNGMY